MRTKTGTMLAVLMLATSATTILPTAAAHTCASYNGCDATACKEGEDHDHTNYNTVTRDEHCSSSSTPKDEDGCTIFGVDDWPSIVCNLIDGDEAKRALVWNVVAMI